MPAKDFDYTGVKESQKKKARQNQLCENKDVLFQNTDKYGQLCNFEFQTDRKEEWIYALLDFRPKNQGMRCKVHFDTRSEIIVVRGKQKSLRAFEEEFNQLRDTVKLKRINLGENHRERRGDDKGEAITVVVLEEFRYSGETGRREYWEKSKHAQLLKNEP